MLDGPISRRYRDNGREIFALTPLQQEARNKIQGKIKSGKYFLEDVPCPLCTSSQKYLLSEKDTYGLPMRTVLCRECGLVYTSPRLADKVLPEFYGVEYRELDRVLPSLEAYFELENKKGASIFRFLAESTLLNRLGGKLVIEIGCGAGGVLAHFKAQGFEVLGCDLVPKNLEYGVENAGLDLHYGDLEIIKKIVADRGAHVGLVIYEQVFEHLPYPKAELEALHAFLPTDSLLYIGVPGLRNIDAHYESDFLRFLQIPHLLHFDLLTLSSMLGACGFSKLIGDESVRAVFKVSPVRQPLQLPGYQDTLGFLTSMEKRRERKAIMTWLTHFPSMISRQVRILIETSGLPRPVKERLVYGLRKLRDCLKKMRRQ